MSIRKVAIKQHWRCHPEINPAMGQAATDFLESNAICLLAGTPLPTPTLPASGEGANSSPACGGRRREFGEHVLTPPKPAGYAKPAVDR
jgi:hypothetical protein